MRWRPPFRRRQDRSLADPESWSALQGWPGGVGRQAEPLSIGTSTGRSLPGNLHRWRLARGWRERQSQLIATVLVAK